MDLKQNKNVANRYERTKSMKNKNPEDKSNANITLWKGKTNPLALEGSILSISEREKKKTIHFNTNFNRKVKPSKHQLIVL